MIFKIASYDLFNNILSFITEINYVHYDSDVWGQEELQNFVLIKTAFIR